MRLEDFRNLPEGLLSKKDRESFLIFETFEDIQREYIKKDWLECFEGLDHRMYPFRLSSDTKKALEHFGITEEQQKAYEEDIDKKRQFSIKSSAAVQAILGTVWGFWYDHDWCKSMEDLLNYCDEHGIPYKYFDP
jgi:hypothetical protein